MFSVCESYYLSISIRAHTSHPPSLFVQKAKALIPHTDYGESQLIVSLFHSKFVKIIIGWSFLATGVSKINRPAAQDVAKGEGEQAAMSLKMSRLNFDPLIIQYKVAIRKVNQIPLCTPILTFAPPFWHLVRPLKKCQFWQPKKGKTGPKKKTFSESILVWTFCKKPDPNCSKFAPVAPFTFYSSLYGVATLYPVSAPKYQRDRVQQYTRSARTKKTNLFPQKVIFFSNYIEPF